MVYSRQSRDRNLRRRREAKEKMSAGNLGRSHAQAERNTERRDHPASNHSINRNEAKHGQSNKAPNDHERNQTRKPSREYVRESSDEGVKNGNGPEIQLASTVPMQQHVVLKSSWNLSTKQYQEQPPLQLLRERNSGAWSRTANRSCDCFAQRPP